MMDHSIEINEMTRSMNSTVQNRKNSVNREPWAEKLTTRLEDECKSWTPPNPLPNAMPKQNASIFKLRYNQDDEELYKVCAVGIGPYNHHKSGLLFSDTEKRDTVMLSTRVYRIDFKTFFSEISPKINEVRACYAEGSFELDDEALCEMMFFDGCFIICAIMVLSRGLLFSTWNKRMDREEEPLINACKSLVRKLNQKAREVMADLLMLENQIPFFVMHILWEHCFLDITFDGVLFKDVALACFDDLYPRRSRSRVTSQSSDFLHLLDLFHWSRSPIDRFREIATYSQPGLYISTVMELQASSVIFKKSASDCFLDIIFSERFFRTKGVIFIPEINLYAYSRRIFQNLIAFEQAYGLRGYGFTAYVECMAQLVQTEKDVSLLRSSGIIASTPVTDIEVVDFFRTLRAGAQVEEMPPDLYELYEQVKDHVEHRPRFPNKWITISMFSVSILALTFLQALYSIIGYYAPTNGH
ncbi:hypothetical protein FCM35_KLT02825 [Carex littledalei]|uniref:Uncharacterized protein n=1 Tax=Carex littledalei TaxID=544730 RepID=A0A833QXC6_9POAL|nr:hypothetical protein FCM35_KLT02825 [Carex littledalei]